jgi:pimeloyl-ACP methyl ester carboxylesterase
VTVAISLDGRTLAVDDPDPDGGRPVFLLHGTPGSRAFRPPRALSQELGLRVVTYDRPGYGNSDPRPGRTVLDTGRDVAAVLDHLGLDRVALVGWSGGGAFACGAARALGPARIERLVLVGSPGPLDEVPGGWDALGEYRWPTAEMARQDPSRSARAIARHMEPYLENPVLFLGSGRGPDGEVTHDPAFRPMLEAQVTAALAQGTAGLAADLVALWLDWGFRLGEIDVPTRVFQGALDRDNHADAETYATRIPDARLVVWPDEGHFGLLRRWPEVLAPAP